MLISNN